MNEARWRYWDVLAFAAGAMPFVMSVFAGMGGVGPMFFAGLSGPFLHYAGLGCAIVFAIVAFAGWPAGNRWLILAGGALLLVSAAPTFVLLYACGTGNCI